MKTILCVITFLITSFAGYGQSAKAEMFNKKGVDLHNAKDYKGAIEYYNKAIKIDPKFAQAYCYRGYAKVFLQLYQEAIDDCNKAIGLDPKLAYAYYYRGDAKMYLQQYKESIIDFDQAILLDPRVSVFYNDRGVAKNNLGLYEDAISDFTKAISIDNNSSFYYFNRGYARTNVSEYDEAIKDCNRAIAIDPNNQWAYFYRANAKRVKGQFDEAVEDYDKALSLNPKLTDALFDRGVTKRNQGKYNDAIIDFKNAFSINPKMYGAYYQLGKCYYKLNNIALANENFSKYLTFDAKSSFAAFARFYLGQKDIAISQMEEIVKNSPTNNNYYDLARLYANAGEYENAIKNLDIALSRGYKQFDFIQKDDDLELIRYKSSFTELMKKYNIATGVENNSLTKMITSEVKSEIIKWQEKGEFETNAAYAERMKTRDEEVKKVTVAVTDKLKNQELQKVTWDIAKIGKYDSEGQSFMITFEGLNGIIINVPIEEAPSFKEKFKSFTISQKDMLIANDNWVISELVCTDPTSAKSYRYDIKNQPNYNPNQLFSLNFDALDIKLNQYTDNQTKNPNDSKTITIGKDSIDTDIPVSNTSNTNTFALVIGNENYKSEITAPFALNDATIFAEYCKKTLGLPANNVHLLKDATYGQMLGEIKWLEDVLRAYNGKAKAIFYYAGHGMPDEQDKSSYLLPIDGNSSIPATALKTDALYSSLSGITNEGVFVFLDACFSGAAREGTLAKGRGVKIRPKESILKGSIIVFSAASGEETSLPLKDKSHGLFTYYLLKKLKDNKGDANLSELVDYVTTEVKQQSIVVNSKSQNPKVNMSLDMEPKWKLLKLK